MVFLHEDGSPLVNSESVGLIRSCLRYSSASPDFLTYSLRFRLVRWIIRGIEALILPNVISHYGMRKRMIRRALDSCLLNFSPEAFVHLGAGFDTYSSGVLGAFPDVRCYELDHPATQAVKTRTLKDAKNSSRLHSAVRFHSVDLDIRGSLRSLIEERQSAILVAEGLFMYFTEDRLCSMLNEIRDTFVDCLLIFTFIEETCGRPDFFENSPFVNLYLRWHQEPFLWGITLDELSPFLMKNGFNLIEVLDPATELEKHLNKRIGRRIKERICIARGIRS